MLKEKDFKPGNLTEEQWESKRRELCDCGIDHSLLSLHEEWCLFRKFALELLVKVCRKN